jgi:hypothetical protein
MLRVEAIGKLIAGDFYRCAFMDDDAQFQARLTCTVYVPFNGSDGNFGKRSPQCFIARKNSIEIFFKHLTIERVAFMGGYRARIRNHGHSCFLCEIVIRSQFHTTYEPEA